MSENLAQADTTELGATQVESGAQNQTQQTVADDLAAYNRDVKALLESDGADGSEVDGGAVNPPADGQPEGGVTAPEGQPESGEAQTEAEAGQPEEVAAEGQGEAEAGNQEGEGQSGEISDTLPERVRLTSFEDRDKQAIALVKSKTAKNLVEAIKMLDARDGKPDQQGEQTEEGQQPQSEFAKLTNIQAVEQERLRLMGEIRKAESDLRFEDKHGLEDKLAELINHGRGVLRQAEARQAQIEDEAKDYKRQAATVYPDLTNQNSALFKEVVRLNGVEKGKNSSLYHSPIP